MSALAEFGIIEALDMEKDYSVYEPQTYHCVSIDDDALDNWWPRIESMKSYFHTYSRPETALARYGVTLIPPESLGLFHAIVSENTRPEYLEQAAAVLAVVEKAKHNGKFVIHFGV